LKTQRKPFELPDPSTLVFLPHRQVIVEVTAIRRIGGELWALRQAQGKPFSLQRMQYFLSF
jgi:hypothetical protein